jgi:hypothetical protein
MRIIVALALLIGLGLPSAASSQTTTRPAPAPAGRFVAIGCLTRQGTAPAARYLITDPRSTPPTVYRLDGDAAALAAHVGHTVEVAGPLTPAATSGTPDRLKVTSLVWIASRCRT